MSHHHDLIVFSVKMKFVMLILTIPTQSQYDFFDRIIQPQKMYCQHAVVHWKQIFC